MVLKNWRRRTLILKYTCLIGYGSKDGIVVGIQVDSIHQERSKARYLGPRKYEVQKIIGAEGIVFNKNTQPFKVNLISIPFHKPFFFSNATKLYRLFFSLNLI